MEETIEKNVYYINCRDFSSEKINAFFEHKNKIKDLSISDDNQYFVSVSQDEIIIRNWKSMNKIKILQIGGQCVQFVQNDKQLILGQWTQNEREMVGIIDWENIKDEMITGKQILQKFNENKIFEVFIEDEHRSEIIQIDGKFIYSLHKDQKNSQTYVLDTKIYSQIAFFKQKVVVNTSTKQILLIGENRVCIEIKKLDFNGLQNWIQGGNYGLCYFYGFEFTQREQIFLLLRVEVVFLSKTGEVLNRYFLDNSSFSQICFSNKSEQLCLIGRDMIFVLNYSEIIQNLEQSVKKQPTTYWLLQLQPDLREKFYLNEQHSVLISFSNLYICIWDLEAKITLPKFQAHSQQINTIAFSLDGETFATGSNDKIIKIWNFHSYLKTKFEEYYQDSLNKLHFTQTDFVLISDSLDNTLRLWDIEQKTEIKIFRNVHNYIGYKNNLIIRTKNSQIHNFDNGLDEQKLKLLQLDLFQTIEPKLIKYQDVIFDNPFFNEDGKYLLIYQNENSLDINKFQLLDEINIYLQNYSSHTPSGICYFNRIQPNDYLIQRNHVNLKTEYGKCIKLKFKPQKIIYYDYLIIIQIQNQIIIYDKRNMVKQSQEDDYLNIELNTKHQISEIKVCKKYIISLDKEGIIYFWEIGKKYYEVVLGLDRTIVNNEICIIIQISKNGNTLALGYKSGILRIFTISNIENIDELAQYQVPLKSKIECIQFSLQYNIVSCLSSEFIWFFHLKDQQRDQILRSTYKCYKKYFFHPTQPLIYFVKNRELTAFHIFDSFDIQELRIQEVIGIRKFSIEYNFLLYDNQQGELKIFDTKNNQELKKIRYSHQVKQIQSSSSGNIIATINAENQVECWEVSSNSVMIKNINEDKNRNITSLAISPDNQILVFANKDSELFMMNIQTSKILLQIPDLIYPVKSIAFTFNQQIFALGLNDGTILLYSFNHQEIDPISQLKNSDYKLDYQNPPICIKMISRMQQLLATGCKMNENTKIIDQNQVSLLEVFLQKSKFDSIILK